MEPEAKRQLLNSADRLRRLIELDAPAAIIANEITGVFLPKMARLLGGKPVAAALGDMVLKLLNHKHGVCRVCNENPAVRDSTGDDVCTACDAEFKEDDKNLMSHTPGAG